MAQIYPPDRRIDMCRRLVAMRRTIGEAIGYRLCPSPVWDMLLDLYLAQYEKREVYLFSLYTAARNVSTIVRQPGREIKLSSFGPWPVG